MMENGGFSFLLEPSDQLVTNFKLLIDRLNSAENLANVDLEDLQVRIELFNQKISQLNDELESLLNTAWSTDLQVSQAEREQWCELQHRGQVVKALAPYIWAYSILTHP